MRMTSEACSGSMVRQPSPELPFEIDIALGGAAVKVSKQVTFTSRHKPEPGRKEELQSAGMHC